MPSMCGSRGVLAVQAHDTSAAMFACQVGRQLRPLPLPKTAMCRPSQPAGGCGDVQSAPAASHLGMLLLPSLPRAGAQPGARGRKISAWQPTKAPRGGSHTTATSRSAGIWQGQASSCSGMCRDNQGSGSQSCWKSHLGVGWKWSKLLEIPSWRGSGSQETELLHGNTRASPSQEKCPDIPKRSWDAKQGHIQGSSALKY